MTERIQPTPAESSEPTQASTQTQMSKIEHFPEVSLTEVLAKKKAFNDLIPVLSKLLQNVGQPTMDSVESMPTDLIDRAVEAENDNQDSDIIVSALAHARDELVRLGNKEETMLGDTEKAA